MKIVIKLIVVYICIISIGVLEVRDLESFKLFFIIKEGV